MLPNEKGYFGEYGGKYVPETLMVALREVEDVLNDARGDEKFMEEMEF